MTGGAGAGCADIRSPGAPMMDETAELSPDASQSCPEGEVSDGE